MLLEDVMHYSLPVMFHVFPAVRREKTAVISIKSLIY